MAGTPPEITPTDMRRLQRALGLTALCDEAIAAAGTLSSRGREAFIGAITEAVDAGTGGHRAVWTGFVAAAAAASDLRRKGGA